MLDTFFIFASIKDFALHGVAMEHLVATGKFAGHDIDSGVVIY
jgi:hypothetical protein